MVNRTPSKGDSRVRVTLLALSYSIYLISIVTASLPKPFTPGVAARRAIAPRLGPGLVPWGGGAQGRRYAALRRTSLIGPFRIDRYSTSQLH